MKKQQAQKKKEPQKYYISNILRKNNLLFSFTIVICNILAFYIGNFDKSTVMNLCIFINCLMFFLYRFITTPLVNKNWLAIKRELMYINYPITVGLFFLFFVGVLVFDIVWLSRINKDALNVTFVFAYFMSTITMLLPAILLLAFMHLIYPALILPSMDLQKKSKHTDKIILGLFVLFILYSTFQFGMNFINSLDFIKKDKYKAAKLPVQYSKEHLKYTDLSQGVERKLREQKVTVPFLYTTEGYSFKTYAAAEQFCSSMNAKVASHLEIYNIIFHRFDTFGNKYYWTSDKAGKNSIVLHFKDMSYEVMKKPKNVIPIVYCTAETSSEYNMFAQKYFYKTKPVEIGNEKLNIDAKYKVGGKISVGEKLKLDQKMNLDVQKMLEFEKLNLDTSKQTNKQQVPPPPPAKENVSRHVNFNVRYVGPDYFNELLNKGYYYESNTSSENSNKYQPRNALPSSNIELNPYSKEINLCYFPYTEYGDMPIQSQKQIWKQSFCTPSFEMINARPEIKSVHEKESYCYAHGGRLPNIPELMAILVQTGQGRNGAKYWTNNKVNTSMYEQNHIAVRLTDKKSVEVKEIKTTEGIYTYCIKDSKTPSRIISNFKSRYYGENGADYARIICPNCKYQEMPDTVLRHY